MVAMEFRFITLGMLDGRAKRGIFFRKISIRFVSVGGWGLLPFKGCQIARREARLCTHHSSIPARASDTALLALNNRLKLGSNIH